MDKNYEKILKAQRRISAITDDVILCYSVSKTMGLYFYLKCISKDICDFNINISEPIEDIILKAKELIEPKWKNIDDSNACIQLIGQEIWLDKEIPYIVTGIFDGYLLCGEVKLAIDRCYRKL